MKLLIVGSSVEDFIHSGDTIVNQPGGLFYTASAVDALRDEDDLVYLLTNMSESQSHHYFPLYDRFKLDLVNKVKKLPVIHLYIKDLGERDEKYENLTDPIIFDNTKISETNFDGILVNLITGYDLDSETLKKLKSSFNAPLFLDIHSLTRPMSHDGTREFQKIENIEAWLSSVDILQANETEIMCCGTGETEEMIVENILNLGVKIVLVTKGRTGAKLYYRITNETNSLFVKSHPVETINKVGCGDLFGAAFFVSFLQNHDPVKSLYYSNAAGAAVSTYRSLDLIKNLKNDIDTLLYEK
jgi:sugar/nucleoside kinase (ribokinase family)